MRDLLQHLAHDDLDVLVVDAHALQAVDLLDLVDQVLLHRLDALDAQDVVRVDRALGEAVARRARSSPSCTCRCWPCGIRYFALVACPRS